MTKGASIRGVWSGLFGSPSAAAPIPDTPSALSHAQIGALLCRAALRWVPTLVDMQPFAASEGDLSRDTVTYHMLSAGPHMAAAVLSHTRQIHEIMAQDALSYPEAAAKADIFFEDVDFNLNHQTLYAIEELLHTAAEWHHAEVCAAVELSESAARGVLLIGSGQSMEHCSEDLELMGGEPEYIASNQMLKSDHAALSAGRDVAGLLAEPLWRDGPMPQVLADKWDQTKAQLLSAPEAGWQVWIDWYEARLSGQPLDLELLEGWIAAEVEMANARPLLDTSARNLALAARLAKLNTHRTGPED